MVCYVAHLYRLWVASTLQNFTVIYRIAGKFGRQKVWRIQSSKNLAKKSLANMETNNYNAACALPAAHTDARGYVTSPRVLQV